MVEVSRQASSKQEEFLAQKELGTIVCCQTSPSNTLWADVCTERIKRTNMTDHGTSQTQACQEFMKEEGQLISTEHRALRTTFKETINQDKDRYGE